MRSLDESSSTWRVIDLKAREINVGPQGAVFAIDVAGGVLMRAGVVMYSVGPTHVHVVVVLGIGVIFFLGSHLKR